MAVGTITAIGASLIVHTVGVTGHCDGLGAVGEWQDVLRRNGGPVAVTEGGVVAGVVTLGTIVAC